MSTGWRRKLRLIVLPRVGSTVHVNATVGNIPEHIIRRVFRTALAIGPLN